MLIYYVLKKKGGGERYQKISTKSDYTMRECSLFETIETVIS